MSWSAICHSTAWYKYNVFQYYVCMNNLICNVPDLYQINNLFISLNPYKHINTHNYLHNYIKKWFIQICIL